MKQSVSSYKIFRKYEVKRDIFVSRNQSFSLMVTIILIVTPYVFSLDNR